MQRVPVRDIAWRTAACRCPHTPFIRSPTAGPVTRTGGRRRQRAPAGPGHGRIPYQRRHSSRLWPGVIPAAGVRYTSGSVAHVGNERSPLRWRSGQGRWGRNERDPAHRPGSELGERHPLRCTAVSRWTGMPICPKVMVRLQIDRAIGPGRYLFAPSANPGGGVIGTRARGEVTRCVTVRPA